MYMVVYIYIYIYIYIHTHRHTYTNLADITFEFAIKRGLHVYLMHINIAMTI